MDKKSGLTFGNTPRGPREIRLDLGTDQLARRFDFDKGMGRKYLDLLKVRLQKEFPHAKVRIRMVALGGPNWWFSTDDGTALVKCREILETLDKMFARNE